MRYVLRTVVKHYQQQWVCLPSKHETRSILEGRLVLNVTKHLLDDFRQIYNCVIDFSRSTLDAQTYNNMLLRFQKGLKINNNNSY